MALLYRAGGSSKRLRRQRHGHGGEDLDWAVVDLGGNGSVWDSIVYDLEFNRIYLGPANSIPPDSAQYVAPTTDNLFVSSIVALDADTGKYVWHYQENSRGDRDYDSTNPMVLANLNIDGRLRP